MAMRSEPVYYETDGSVQDRSPHLRPYRVRVWASDLAPAGLKGDCLEVVVAARSGSGARGLVNEVDHLWYIWDAVPEGEPVPAWWPARTR